MPICCISFDSYIKPQHCIARPKWKKVVYLLIPTSNHNWWIWLSIISWVVYLLIPTSNHNHAGLSKTDWRVVYLLIPTSNHNLGLATSIFASLYIFWFLHQTTTKIERLETDKSCISFDSYIKPQQFISPHGTASVVYLLIPTSNHNL